MLGLGAALKLHEKNVNNFLVLEAKDYIGGRLREAKWFGETIALGAGWIHDIETNHKIYKLAQKYGLKCNKDTYDLNKASLR